MMGRIGEPFYTGLRLVMLTINTFDFSRHPQIPLSYAQTLVYNLPPNFLKMFFPPDNDDLPYQLLLCVSFPSIRIVYVGDSVYIYFNLFIISMAHGRQGVFTEY